MRLHLALAMLAVIALQAGCALWDAAAIGVTPAEARRSVRRSWEEVDLASKYCPAFQKDLYGPFQLAERQQRAAERFLAEGSFRDAYRLARRAGRQARDAKSAAIAYRERVMAEIRSTAQESIRSAERAIATATGFPGAYQPRVERAAQWIKQATHEISYGDFGEGKLFSDFARKEAVEACSPQPTVTNSGTPTATRTATVTPTPSPFVKRHRQGSQGTSTPKR